MDQFTFQEWDLIKESVATMVMVASENNELKKSADLLLIYTKIVKIILEDIENR